MISVIDLVEKLWRKMEMRFPTMILVDFYLG